MILPSPILSRLLGKQLGDSQSAHAMVAPRCSAPCQSRRLPRPRVVAHLDCSRTALDATYCYGSYKLPGLYPLLTNCHSSSPSLWLWPFLHSLPIAHNLYIRRRELSLLLIALLKLQPLLTLRHYSHAHRPLNGSSVYVSACDDCPNTHTILYLYSRTSIIQHVTNNFHSQRRLHFHKPFA